MPINRFGRFLPLMLGTDLVGEVKLCYNYSNNFTVKLPSDWHQLADLFI